MKTELIEGSETSEYINQTPGNYPKGNLLYVEFYSKNKIEKLVHLFGFIIRIYHDARSSEGQINPYPANVENKVSS